MRGRRKRTVNLLPLKVYLLTYNYSIVNMGGVARIKIPLLCANREGTQLTSDPPYSHKQLRDPEESWWHRSVYACAWPTREFTVYKCIRPSRRATTLIFNTYYRKDSNYLGIQKQEPSHQLHVESALISAISTSWSWTNAGSIPIQRCFQWSKLSKIEQFGFKARQYDYTMRMEWSSSADLDQTAPYRCSLVLVCTAL